MSQKSCRVWLSGCILPSWNGVSFVQFHRPRRMYIAKGSETYFLSYRLYHIIWILNCKFWILRYLLQPIISGDQFQLWSMWCWSVRIGRIVWTSMFTSLSFNASYNRWWIYESYNMTDINWSISKRIFRCISKWDLRRDCKLRSTWQWVSLGNGDHSLGY